ncbi:hypothetical protein A6770_14885 [Nostoc minutum NIES-26]|uniref:Uncharacterized protein n=1 Tax=Nostoc minutum NIES-26 TaxID=1844469 RepID=A0A367RNN2_9NOSO|nr:hypothetical protein A6770_14885 [Nostoc minutum NIES-26]
MRPVLQREVGRRVSLQANFGECLPPQATGVSDKGASPEGLKGKGKRTDLLPCPDEASPACRSKLKNL